jgi:formate-dependent phosphoribosylglycinamide formyltransferase (GAR transformylase)
MSSKRALLLGSSFSAMPLLDRLKRRGIHVAVVGNQPGDPCHAYADESVALNYAKPDELINFLVERSFDYLVPSCNDFSYLTGTQLAIQFGFAGYDTVQTASILHNKHLFRQFTSSHGFAVPTYVLLDNDRYLESPIGYPCMIKPVDSFSGRGIAKVMHPNSWIKAFDDARAASRTGMVIVEQYVSGSLHSHSAFIRQQEIIKDSFVDEFCTVYPYQVNCSNHPSKLTISIRERIRDQINRLVTELEMVDGLLHTQFMVSDGNIYLIECMRRCPGDLFGVLIEKSTGLDYMDMYLQPFLSEPLTVVTDDAHHDRPVSRHTITVDKLLSNYEVSWHIPALRWQYVPLKESGQPLSVAPYDKLGIVFAEHTDNEELWDFTPLWRDYIDIRTHFQVTMPGVRNV